MTNLGTLLRSEHGLFSLSEHLVQIVSHHDSVLIEQIVWDALGSESWSVSRQGAFAASHAMLSSIAGSLGIDGPSQILDLATELFSALGFGQLRFEAGAGGGRFTGEDLLLGSGFRDRYGRAARIKHSMDAFAAGYGSAAASVAFPSDWGAFEADEASCVARGASECVFTLSRRADAQRASQAATRGDADELVTSEADEDDGNDAGARATALATVLALSSDERGILRVGAAPPSPHERARLALVPVGYRSEIVFDAHHLLEKRSPELAPLFRDLVREATQASVFLTITELEGALAMAELERPVTSEERAHRFAAIASALGWGTLSVADYAVDRIVLRAPITPEAVYFTARYGGMPGAQMPGFQGMAGAIALLTMLRDRVGPATFADYAKIAATGPTLSVEETRSIVRGDAECEVVVTIKR
ncbi:MAG: hypothetical protein U0414_26760 [Polyangiaceae bacterium]